MVFGDGLVKSPNLSPKPVGGDLNVQRHLDIQQVLVFAQVTRHFSFGASQGDLQLLDRVLRTNQIMGTK